MTDMKMFVDFVMNLCCFICIFGILSCVVWIILEFIYIIKTGEK